MIFVYTTIKDREDADALASEVIELKLAACVDMWPIKSVYIWEGKQISLPQYMVMCTTHSVKAADLEAHIVAKHPYTVPLIARTNIDVVNNAYQRWVSDTLDL